MENYNLKVGHYANIDQRRQFSNTSLKSLVKFNN